MLQIILSHGLGAEVGVAPGTIPGPRNGLYSARPLGWGAEGKEETEPQMGSSRDHVPLQFLAILNMFAALA